MTARLCDWVVRAQPLHIRDLCLCGGICIFLVDDVGRTHLIIYLFRYPVLCVAVTCMQFYVLCHVMLLSAGFCGISARFRYNMEFL